MISDLTLNTIRERIDIVELVSEYVQLKRAGQSYVGLCPFHGEKTPSFHVHTSKQCFHCFGCHKGGNIFTFLSAIEGLSFPQTVEKLADRAGVTIEKNARTQIRSATPAPAPSELRILEANEWAAKYFHYLLTEVDEGKGALEYLTDRSITPETIKRFQLGVAPKGWNTLLTLMGRRGFQPAELARAGLAIEKSETPGRYYDRFRERLMFPIRNKDGRCIGFGARILKDEPNQPKYLNSPESESFSKRKTLYGLWENQRGIRLAAEAILVEGYMDVIGLAQAGIQNAIATMGTALTEDHCLWIRTLTRKAITVFDPDRAGADAWHRSVHLFLEAGIFARDLTLPEGMDPDEFAIREGAEKFRALCEKAPRQVTKMLKEIAARGSLSEKERGDILTKLTPILIASRRLPDRALLWDDVSMLLNVSHSALQSLVNEKSGVKTATNTSASPRVAARPAPRPGAKKSSLPPLELTFFRLALQKPERFLSHPAEEWLPNLQHPEIHRWLEKLHRSTDPDEFLLTLDQLVQSVEDQELVPYASEGMFIPDERTNSSSAEEFDGVLSGLRRARREREIRALSAQVKLAQKLGDGPEQMSLLEKLRALRAETDKNRLSLEK